MTATTEPDNPFTIDPCRESQVESLKAPRYSTLCHRSCARLTNIPPEGPGEGHRQKSKLFFFDVK